jgi:hypothetical protein
VPGCALCWASQLQHLLHARMEIPSDTTSGHIDEYMFADSELRCRARCPTGRDGSISFFRRRAVAAVVDEEILGTGCDEVGADAVDVEVANLGVLTADLDFGGLGVVAGRRGEVVARPQVIGVPQRPWSSTQNGDGRWP